MGSYKTNLVTDQTLDSLLSGAAWATTTGQLLWRVQKPRVHEGKIKVLTRLSDCAVGELRIYYVDPRPSEIHCQYLVNGAPIRRLDVNGSHRKIVNRLTNTRTSHPVGRRVFTTLMIFPQCRSGLLWQLARTGRSLRRSPRSVMSCSAMDTGHNREGSWPSWTRRSWLVPC